MANAAPNLYANVSVMRKGAKKFGTKVEVKNMNSSKNVKRAIEFEIQRQIKIVSITHNRRLSKNSFIS